MFNNNALDVVIGLIFIYLLYSLFATILAEMIATNIGLRARNLKEAVDRMLNDEPETDEDFWDGLKRLWDSFKLTKNPTNPRIINFYNHPEIKYLGSTGIFRTPSSFKAISFSKTLLYLLNEIGYKKSMGGDAKMKDPDTGDIKEIPIAPVTKERINLALESIIREHADDKNTEKDKIVLDHETAKYVFSLWQDSYGDILKFKLHLENWFDRTMEQALEWYRRKIQVVLLILGFMLAWFFNADTFTIIRKLSVDEDARKDMVTLAAAYIEANNQASAAVNSSAPKEKIDALLISNNRLEQDLASANNILGLGGFPADSVLVKIDPLTKSFIYIPQIDEEVVMDMKRDEIVEGNYIFFDGGEKAEYFFKLFPLHFFGFLVTAIAISLGAPFWFDLLNKLMRLRTAVKQPIQTPQHSASKDNGGYVSPINREA